MSIDSIINSDYVEVEQLKIHYLSAGNGEPVLLLHGWPTSSYLWRNIIKPLAKTNWVIAPDLPGFGKSDKPLDVAYTFKYYTTILDAFVNNLGISQTNLVVHDLGGPIGLLWAVENQQKIIRIGLLNTLVYADQPSIAVKLFVFATFIPFLNNWMSSPAGIATALRLGVVHKSRLTPEILANYQQPFQSKQSRQALFKSIHHLNPKKFAKVGEKLSTLNIPVRIIYGKNDLALPDVAITMKRVQQELPQTQVTELPGCGHFLQEDEPQRVSELLAEFLVTR